MSILPKMPVAPRWIGQVMPILNAGNDPLSRQESIGLYIIIPIILAVVLGWNHIPFGTGVPRTSAIMLTITLVLGLWNATAICSGILFSLMRRISPPLWLTATCGVVVTTIAVLPVVRIYLTWGFEWTGSTFLTEQLGEVGANLHYFRKLFANVFPGGLCWVLANYFYRNILCVQRFGSETSSIVKQPSAFSPGETKPQELTSLLEPAFVSMLPVQQRGQVVALKAEDHYLQVYTENGAGLVRSRFTDALNSVAGLKGLQVHRSYWVNTAFIRSFHKQGHAFELEMTTGLKVPVSRAYSKDLKSIVPAAS